MPLDNLYNQPASYITKYPCGLYLLFLRTLYKILELINDIISNPSLVFNIVRSESSKIRLKFHLIGYSIGGLISLAAMLLDRTLARIPPERTSLITTCHMLASGVPLLRLRDHLLTSKRFTEEDTWEQFNEQFETIIGMDTLTFLEYIDRVQMPYIKKWTNASVQNPYPERNPIIQHLYSKILLDEINQDSVETIQRNSLYFYLALRDQIMPYAIIPDSFVGSATCIPISESDHMLVTNKCWKNDDHLKFVNVFIDNILRVDQV